MSNPIEIGLADNQRKDIAEGLSGILADTYILYAKTHGYHWNVTGPLFVSLHTLFEAQYQQLFAALDELAERIRALGVMAPTGLGKYRELSDLQDDPEVPEATSMVRNLQSDHEHIIRKLRTVIGQAAEAGDEGTADMLTTRLEEHEKTAWMLRSLVG